MVIMQEKFDECDEAFYRSYVKNLLWVFLRQSSPKIPAWAGRLAVSDW